MAHGERTVQAFSSRSVQLLIRIAFFSSCAPGSAQAGGEQPGAFCDSGDGRLRQAGGGDASRAAGGGPVRGAPTGPGRRPDQLGPHDGSGGFALSTGSCS